MDANTPVPQTPEEAVAECISDDALSHLRTYKYSSVDKSPVSYYILGPYVRTPSPAPVPFPRVWLPASKLTDGSR